MTGELRGTVFLVRRGRLIVRLDRLRLLAPRIEHIPKTVGNEVRGQNRENGQYRRRHCHRAFNECNARFLV